MIHLTNISQKFFLFSAGSSESIQLNISTGSNESQITLCWILTLRLSVCSFLFPQIGHLHLHHYLRRLYPRMPPSVSSSIWSGRRIRTNSTAGWRTSCGILSMPRRKRLQRRAKICTKNSKSWYVLEKGTVGNCNNATEIPLSSGRGEFNSARVFDPPTWLLSFRFCSMFRSSVMAFHWNWPTVPSCRVLPCSTSRTPTGARTCGVNICPRNGCGRDRSGRSWKTPTKSWAPTASTRWTSR